MMKKDFAFTGLEAAIVLIAFVVVVIIMLLNLEKTEKVVEGITNKILPGKFQEKIQKIFMQGRRLISGKCFLQAERKNAYCFTLK